MVVPESREGCFLIKRENGNLTVRPSSEEIVRYIPGHYFKTLDFSVLTNLVLIPKGNVNTLDSQKPSQAHPKTESAAGAASDEAPQFALEMDTKGQSESSSLLTRQNLSIAAAGISLLAAAMWVFRRIK